MSNHSDVVSTRSAQGVRSLLAGKRILFVAEAVTLAHVARPLALSSALENSGCELSFACNPDTHWLLKDFGGQLPSAAANQRLRELLPLIGKQLREKNPSDPSRLLAGLPFNIYLTTNPDNLLEAAIRAVDGRDPQVFSFCWSKDTQSNPANISARNRPDLVKILNHS